MYGFVGMRKIIAAFGFLAIGQVSFASDEFHVAAGSVAVTPPQQSYLAGYGPDRKSTGQLDDIWVKAVLVKSEHELLAIITIDCIGLTRPDILRINDALQKRLPGVHVVVSSTHTHAGPDVVGIWGPALWRSGRDEKYMDALVESAAQLVINSVGQLQPAQSRVVSVDMPLEWVENVSEKGLLDTRLAVLQFIDAAGQTIATLTNYACHPTILGPDNTLVSADYVQGFYAQMALQLGGEHLFLQGAIGGWVQPVQGNRSHALAVSLGKTLADATLSALTKAEPNPYAPLRFASKVIDVPLENWGFRLLMWLGVLDRELFDGAMRTSVAWFQLGNVQFVTHPGETSPAYSFASRDVLDTKHTFVLGLSQDAMGYILKPEYFADDVNYPHAEYLSSVSVGPQAGPMVMAAIEELVASASPSNSGQISRP